MTASKTIGTGTNTTGVNGTGLFIKGKLVVIAYQNRNNAIIYPHSMVIKMKIRVGSYYYSGRGINGSWTTTDSFCQFTIKEGSDVDFYTLERTYDSGNIKIYDYFNEPRMINLGDSRWVFGFRLIGIYRVHCQSNCGLIWRSNTMEMHYPPI